MSKLLNQLKESSPNVKLGVAVAAGVVIGVVGTVGIQAYGNHKEKRATEQALRLQAPDNIIPLRIFRQQAQQ